MKPSFPPVQRVPQAGLLALALLAGCAGHSEPPRDTQQQAQIQNFVGKGYLSEEQYSLRTTPQAWTVAGRDLDLILSVPARAGRYPLIVYLPGIGEPRTAGEAWRKTWAQAGYAVLSLQLLAADGQAWQSRSARNGDFQSVVRERFGAAAMAERQAALADLLAELHRRHDDPLLQNVDLNRVVLAGYDLGAYTALVAAGEKTKAAAGSRRAPLPLAAVVLLSPYADFSGPGLETRYQDVAVPVLSVTGDGDEDSYGLVNSASVRRAPFQYMPAGGKYLLSFNDATHDLLSGNAPRERNRDEDGNQGSQNGEDRNGGNGGGRHGGRSGGPGGMGGGQGGPGGGMDGGFGNRGGQQGGRGGDGPGGSGNPYLQPAIQAVTTAFLDSVVKQDDIAQEWLRKDARRWLRDEATLTAK